jgi:hypothetical protein
LSALDIAKILLLQGGKGEPALASHFPKIDNIGRLSADLAKLLETEDFVSPDKKDLIYRYSGLRSLSVDTSHRRTLSSIIQSIRSKQVEGQAAAPRKEVKGLVNAIYVPASDKVLISRNHQLKLVSRGAEG